jgi:hypothetical protein
LRVHCDSGHCGFEQHCSTDCQQLTFQRRHHSSSN